MSHRTFSPPMQISVVGPPSLSAEQIRAYAEYKLFSRLVTLARDITDVHAVITAHHAEPDATCTVAVDLRGAGCVRTRVRRHGAVAAVDAAAETIARAAVRRLARHSCPETFV
jgi:ribosome-associated translation inhibitor RaiA